jgi:hypothetical protein
MKDTAQLAALLGAHGVKLAALEDGIARAEKFFGAQTPTPVEADAWVQTLREEAAHLFEAPAAPAAPRSIPDYSHLPPTDRLTAFRLANPAPARAKPQAVVASPEVLKDLEGKPVLERLTKAHELQQGGA